MAPTKKKTPTNNDSTANSSQRSLRSQTPQLKMVPSSKEVTKAGTKSASSKAGSKASHNKLDKTKANLLASKMVIKFNKILV